MSAPADRPSTAADVPNQAMAFTRALLELTVRENGDAMNTITRMFADVTRLFADVERRCARLRDAFPDPDELDSVAQGCAAGAAALRSGLRAMQLHDITDQRLSHVAAILGALIDGREIDIASVLTDDEERALLRLIEDGVRGTDVLDRLEGSRVRGSVELF